MAARREYVRHAEARRCECGHSSYDHDVWPACAECVCEEYHEPGMTAEHVPAAGVATHLNYRRANRWTR